MRSGARESSEIIVNTSSYNKLSCFISKYSSEAFCEEFVYARLRVQMSWVTMKIKTCHSEDLHSLTNHCMYLEVTLPIEYNLL